MRDHNKNKEIVAISSALSIQCYNIKLETLMRRQTSLTKS